MRAVAFASVILLSLVVQSIYPLNILSFNIKNFGMTKYSKQYVIDVLIDVSLHSRMSLQSKTDDIYMNYNTINCVNRFRF